MGQKGSKDRLTKSDLEFLKSSTRYDEDTIKVREAKKYQALHDIGPHPPTPHHIGFDHSIFGTYILSALIKCK